MNETIVRVRFTHTPAWLYDARLESGSNIPCENFVEVKPSELSLLAREILLAYGSGQYPSHYYGVYYDSEYQLSLHNVGTLETIVIDGLEPTKDQVDQAICAAAKKVAAKRNAWEHKKKQKQVEDFHKKSARELLAEEFEQLNSRIRTLEGALTYWQQDNARLEQRLAELEKEEGEASD